MATEFETYLTELPPVALRAIFGQSSFLIAHKEIKTDYKATKRNIANLRREKMRKMNSFLRRGDPCDRP